MWSTIVEYAGTVWAMANEIAGWLLIGSWYEVMFKILGALGSLFLIQKLHFGLGGDQDNPVFYFTALILILATLFWILIGVALVLIAVG